MKVEITKKEYNVMLAMMNEAGTELESSIDDLKIFNNFELSSKNSDEGKWGKLVVYDDKSRGKNKIKINININEEFAYDVFTILCHPIWIKIIKFIANDINIFYSIRELFNEALDKIVDKYFDD